jgi:ABC-type transporter Mla subunit MlaD
LTAVAGLLSEEVDRLKRHSAELKNQIAQQKEDIRVATFAANQLRQENIGLTASAERAWQTVEEIRANLRHTETKLKKEVAELKEINKAQLEELSAMTEGNYNSDCRCFHSITCHELTAVGDCSQRSPAQGAVGAEDGGRKGCEVYASWLHDRR